MKLLELRMVRSGPQLKCGGVDPPKQKMYLFVLIFTFPVGGTLFSEREKIINWLYREVGRI